MTNWITTNWYVLWGVCGGVLVVWLHFYARRHPDTRFASHWERLRYAAYAAAPAVGAAIILNGVVEGTTGQSLFTFESTPYVFCVLFVLGWLIAPQLKRLLPVDRGGS